MHDDFAVIHEEDASARYIFPTQKGIPLLMTFSSELVSEMTEQYRADAESLCKSIAVSLQSSLASHSDGAGESALDSGLPSVHLQLPQFVL